MKISPLAPTHTAALVRFFLDLPDGDLTFIKEDVADPAAIESWTRPGRPGRRWVAFKGEQIVGYLAVLRLAGWSDHVGEIRLVVGPASRGTGVGRALAREALSFAIEAGLSKLIVELVADQVSALRLFNDLGFSGEALLRDHIRDRHGELRDLVMLSHYVEGTWSAMSTLGLPDELP